MDKEVSGQNIWLQHKDHSSWKQDTSVTGSFTIADFNTKRVEIEKKLIDINNLSAKAPLITKYK